MVYATEAKILLLLGVADGDGDFDSAAGEMAEAVAQSDREMDRWDEKLQDTGKDAAANQDLVDASNHYACYWLLQRVLSRKLRGRGFAGTTNQPAQLPEEIQARYHLQRAKDILGYDQKIPTPLLTFNSEDPLSTWDHWSED